MIYGLSKSHYEQIMEVFMAHPEIETVILYGSRAKGTQKSYSDVDITLISKNIELTQLLKIDTELDDLLLPVKFDVSLYFHIDNKDLMEHINSFGVIFYKKEN